MKSSPFIYITYVCILLATDGYYLEPTVPFIPGVGSGTLNNPLHYEAIIFFEWHYYTHANLISALDNGA